MSNHDHSGFGIITTIILIGFILIGAKACSEFKCEDIESNSGIKTKFSWWTGCYVKVQGRWIPKDSWRGEYEQARQPELEHVEEQVIEQ